MVKVKTLLSLVYLTSNREKSYEGVNFCCYEISMQLFFIHH